MYFFRRPSFLGCEKAWLSQESIAWPSEVRRWKQRTPGGPARREKTVAVRRKRLAPRGRGGPHSFGCAPPYMATGPRRRGATTGVATPRTHGGLGRAPRERLGSGFRALGSLKPGARERRPRALPGRSRFAPGRERLGRSSRPLPGSLPSSLPKSDLAPEALPRRSRGAPEALPRRS